MHLNLYLNRAWSTFSVFILTYEYLKMWLLFLQCRVHWLIQHHKHDLMSHELLFASQLSDYMVSALFSVTIHVRVTCGFSLWTIHQFLPWRINLKVFNMAFGSRLEKQATFENSSQMLMFLRTVCASCWEERICLWAFHLFLLLIFSALHGLSLAGLIACFMATSPASFLVWKMRPSAIWTSLKVK